MKLLQRLEKSKDFWYLILASVFFFAFRFPSLFEPNWYGDEGIYQAIGIAMNHGRVLYSQIWDNKPPLLYLLYALLQSDQFFIRLISIVFGVLSLLVLYFFSLKLFQRRSISIFVTSFFSLVFSIPLFEGNIANAENFILLPILIAGYLLYNNKFEKNKLPLFFSGLFLGIAFLFKIIAIFDFLAFLLFLIFSPDMFSFFKKGSFSFLFRYFFLFFGGFLLPFLISCIYFFAHHAFWDFMQSAFSGNVNYVGYGNSFIIPQGFLVLKLLVLFLYLFVLLFYRKRFDRPSLFILLWLGFSVFSAFFSQRPYTHYVLVALPSFSLALGLILYQNALKLKTWIFLLLLVVSLLFVKNFNNYGYVKTYMYYQNFLQYLTGKITMTSYQEFFDPITPRDYAVASFLRNHTNLYEPVFLWGNSAQIYALSKTVPASKYTVAYHITQSNSTIVQTAKDLLRVRPRYVIILAGTPPIPFSMDSYTNVFSFQGALIYERSY